MLLLVLLLLVLLLLSAIYLPRAAPGRVRAGIRTLALAGFSWLLTIQTHLFRSSPRIASAILSSGKRPGSSALAWALILTSSSRLAGARLPRLAPRVATTTTQLSQESISRITILHTRSRLASGVPRAAG